MNKIYVAAIIDDYRLIITAGENEGLRNNIHVEVKDQKGIPIEHPITGKVIDYYARTKQVLKIVEVKNNTSIVETLDTKEDYFYSLNKSDLNKRVDSKKVMKRKLNISPGTEKISRHDRYSDSPIRVGDEVVIVS